MKSSKKFVRLVIIVTIMSFFMFGCGKTQVPTDTSTEKEGLVVETPETTTEVVQPQEEEMAEVVEPEVEEDPVEEDPAEETLANEIIMNSDPIADWVTTLEEEDLKFIIYNDVEGYKQILNDGETYHMKKDDKIFLYHPAGNIKDETVLTPETPASSGSEIFISTGFSLEILWKDKDVVTYGREMLIEGFDEYTSITCTFYKATE